MVIVVLFSKVFILESKDGSIVLDYRFDSRLDEAWKENIREVNNILFGN